jgi:hippurate hydrolase
MIRRIVRVKRIQMLAGLFLAGASCAATPAKHAVVTPQQVASVAGRASVLYAELHAAPELSGQEAHTSARLAQRLRELGFQVEEGVGGYGVVGVLKNGVGKTLWLRTETDALPVEEQTGSPSASRVRARDADGEEVPVAHACGHDLHMAAWAGTAELLVRRRAEWHGTLVLVAQPAEETLSGARALLAAGLLTRFPKADLAFAIHVHDQLPLGTVGYTAGPFAASADWLDLEVRGRGGHGAYPQNALDPIVIAARIVTTLQTIVSRETDPFEPAVVSVGAIHGGSKHNVIPDNVKLKLTVRTYGVENRKRALAAVKRIAEAEASAAGAPPPVLTIKEGTAAAVNDPVQTRALVTALGAVLPDVKLRELPPEMGSEDFGEYAKAGIPSVMLQLGVVDPKRFAAAQAGGEPLPGAHSSKFLPYEPGSLALAIQLETAVALSVLGKLPVR